MLRAERLVLLLLALSPTLAHAQASEDKRRTIMNRLGIVETPRAIRVESA